MIEKNIKVTVQKNKSKEGKEYIAMNVDLGYRKAVITFDKYLIAEICGISVKELYEKTELK